MHGMDRQCFVPMLSYEDGAAAMDWLMRVFGFEERIRWIDEEGKLSHGELAMGGAVVMLASGPEGYECPRRLGENYAPAKLWQRSPYIINGVLVHVPEVDGLYERCQRLGARVLGGIEDGEPGRRFRVEDLEGQRWFFMAPATV